MQISTASLLAAQQQMQSPARPQPSAFGAILTANAAPPKAAPAPSFEPAEFTPATPAKPLQQMAAPAQGAPIPEFRAPGSTLDIKV
ncbi:MAG TPA: hypothetical protein VL026_07310 [Rhizomicrobium sp.]|nr:hypothetical protein [Rhizomicrobium sp.]